MNIYGILFWGRKHYNQDKQYNVIFISSSITHINNRTNLWQPNNINAKCVGWILKNSAIESVF